MDQISRSGRRGKEYEKGQNAGSRPKDMGCCGKRHCRMKMVCKQSSGNSVKIPQVREDLQQMAKKDLQ